MARYPLNPYQVYCVKDGDTDLYFSTTLKTAYNWLMWRVPVELRDDLKSYPHVCHIFKTTGGYKIRSIHGGLLSVFKVTIHKTYQPDLLSAISLV